MAPSPFEILATILFALGILHTFSAKYFLHLSHRYQKGSVQEGLFHFLGEVEVVFGLWAALLLIGRAWLEDGPNAVQWLEGLHFTEPAFVFVIMTIAATRPVLRFAELAVAGGARLVPARGAVAFYFAALVVGPLLGSFITEPAAMTVTALLLKRVFYDRGLSPALKYTTLGVLFVNISIGGVLTPFAAPPILMVAGKWGWDMAFMFKNFGIEAIIAVTINATVAAFFHRRELARLGMPNISAKETRSSVPASVIGLHLIFLAAVVAFAHHLPLFLGVFLFFLGITRVTGRYQDALRMREALLVGFFLAGLVVLGEPQRWWLQPLLSQLSAGSLYLSTTALTAITDNAALTYLGSQVDGLSDLSKYSLASGAIVGGGLTVIANAPNPAGFGILNSSFGQDGIRPGSLFKAALVPTLVALAIFWLKHYVI